MNIVLDTSVTIAWYLPEPLSLQARDWLDKLIKNEIKVLIPSLHFIEFANVLRTRIRKKLLDPALAVEIYGTHLNTLLTVADTPRDVILATTLAYEATAYDASFIALALEHACPLVTAERRTTPWVAKLGRQAIVLG